ncbi:MAG: hypothetical protein ACJ766_02455 [Thermoleophilaceae bacterium]
MAAGMFVGFVLSRTVGMPSFHESDWESSGILSLLLEGFYLAATGWWLRSAVRRARAAEEALPRVGRARRGGPGRAAPPWTRERANPDPLR